MAASITPIGPLFGGSIRRFSHFNGKNNAAWCAIFSVEMTDTVTETHYSQWSQLGTKRNTLTVVWT